MTIQSRQRRKGSIKHFTKFKGMVWNIGNCNMYPKSLSMFYEGSYLKFLLGTLYIALCNKTKV